jgi:hypothetical protein
MKYEGIRVPAHWTADADIARFVALYGESNDYFNDQLDRVYIEFDALEKAIDGALIYFGLGNGDGSTPAINEKILAVYRHVMANVRPETRREMLVEVLFYCNEALSDFGLIVGDNEDEPEETWLSLLIDLCDRLNTASIQLGAAMACAYADFEDRTDSRQTM